jgi:hypothetical protein
VCKLRFLKCRKIFGATASFSDDRFVLHSSYGLFASLSTFLKQEMGVYLQPILKHILETLRSTEGFVVGNFTLPFGATPYCSAIARCIQFIFSFHQTHYNGEEDPTFLIDDENIENEEHGEDSDDDSVTGYVILCDVILS